MRWIEVLGGLRMPINNEESKLVDKIDESKEFDKEKLSEREQELARNLVSRGVLNRFSNDDSIVYYTVNKIQPAWRE